MSSDRTRHPWSLFALGVIVVVTVGWWAAALWPLPAATPDWVIRARAACFGSTPRGLPNSGGWILLVGTPLSMVAALLLIAGGELRGALGAIRATRRGAWLIGGSVAAMIVLSGAAGARVVAAYGVGVDAAREAGTPGGPLPLFRPAPPLRLVDQRGDTASLADHRGRPVLVGFAYGKCGTVCPVIVRSMLEARNATAEMAPVIVIVTLDPWRDTPSRLAHIAESWALTGDAYLLGGEVHEVEATLDRWGVERSRDPRTGEIHHASLAYVLDRDGRLAYAVSGSAAQMVAAVQGLR